MSPQLMDTLSFRRVLLVGLLGASAVAGWSFLRPTEATTTPSFTTASQSQSVSEQPTSVGIGDFEELSEAPGPTSEAIEQRPASIRSIYASDDPRERQINLRVVMAEVNRTAAREIGLDLAVTEVGGIRRIWKTPEDTSSEGYVVAMDNGEVATKVKELKAKNHARSLAEPNLIALNGMPASFLAGGQFPVVVKHATTGADSEEITYVPYGVQFHFTPYVTQKNRIRLAMSMTISRRKFAGDDKTVPELVCRNFATTVELKPGQTMIVAGIKQGAFAAESIERSPAAGEAGTSRTTPHAEESDFVLLITPELVGHKVSNENE